MLGAKQRKKLLDRYENDPKYRDLVDHITRELFWPQLAGVATAVVAYYGGPYISEWFYQIASSIREFAGQHIFEAIGAFVFFLVGSMLYAVRCRFLAYYGTLEIAIGL